MNAYVSPAHLPAHFAQAVSPLALVDRLISLARDADRAGHAGTASGLVELAYAVCDGPQPPAAG